MLLLPGGDFLMGTDECVGDLADGEGPLHCVSLHPFWIDPHAVSNARFHEFTASTGYVTDAEHFGWSFVFAGLLPDGHPETAGVAGAAYAFPGRRSGSTQPAAGCLCSATPGAMS